MAQPKPPPKKGASGTPPVGGKPSPVTQTSALGGKPGGPQKRSGPPLGQTRQATAGPKLSVGEEAAPQNLEDRVLALPALQQAVADAPMPKLFADFVQKMLPRLGLPETSRNILEAFANVDVNAEKVSLLLKANPYYEFEFMSVIESLSKRDDTPSVEGAVVLLGMQNFRNLILGFQLNRMVFGTHPEWTKEGKLKSQPADLLKYAVKSEEAVGDKKSGYADTAYAAGMVYDLLALLINDLAADKKKCATYLDLVYNHGLRSAQIAVEIAKTLPDFGLTKYLFPACIVHDVGKVVMAILEPKYLDFVEGGRKKEWPRAVRQFVEMRRFGVDHSVLSGLVCGQTKILGMVQKAIVHHHEPFLIRADKNNYELASFICLASNIANNFKKTDKLDDPMVAQWKSTELDGFRVNMAAVLAAVSKSVQI